jgi:hypothetical protein
VNLGLDYDGKSKLLNSPADLFFVVDHYSARDGYTVPGEKLLALIFVDFHG